MDALQNDREVSAWIEKVTLSKANRAKLLTWMSLVQQWHQALAAHEQARLDNLVAEWGIPIREIAKLKASSLLKILAVGTVLLARLQERMDANTGKRKWVSRCGDVELLRGSHFFFQCLYLEPMSFGAKVMDVVLWARGKSLLLAKCLGLVQLPLLDKLRIRSANCTWQFFSRPSVIYCRIFLQPELRRFLYVGFSSQSLGARERARWGKYKQIRSGKAVWENFACGGANESATFMCWPLFHACSFGWLLAYYGVGCSRTTEQTLMKSVDTSVACALGAALGEV